MNIYEQRYKNALKQCARGNRLLKKGYQMLDEDGSIIPGPFYLKDNELILRVGENCSYIIFANNKEFDNGYYTKIEDFNKEISKYSFVPKQRFITLGKNMKGLKYV